VKLALVAVTMVVFWSPLMGEIHHVPGEFATIQEAIIASVDGDTVLIARGLYVENINFRGRNITVASEFILDHNPETIIATIIDGGSPAATDTGSCVIINSGEDSTAVLEGLTLTNGIGTKWVDEHGAGTYVEGGGILIQYSSPTIRNNHIVGNFAIRVYSNALSAGGGGIRVGDGTPAILNNVVRDNEGLYGGGIVLNYTGGTVRNNVIANNRVYPATSAPTFGGGGIWMTQNFGTNVKVIENNTIYGNSVTGTGGGGFSGKGGGILVSSTNPVIRNNIVWGNTQVLAGPIATIGGAVPLVSFSDIEGGFTGGGNINADPMVSDTSFYLQAGSPCIDTGDSAASYNDPEDPLNTGFAQWPALGSLRNDMGAYGGPGSAVLGSFLITSVIEGDDSILPERTLLRQNFPNPFNPETEIQFRTAEAGNVSLRIYDLLGREVASLFEGHLDAGNHMQRWNAAGQAAGVYFYRLTTGTTTEARRLILLR